MELTLSMARKLVEIGKEKAVKDYGRPICMAVCDNAGSLVTFDRMEGSPLRSIRLCQSKAYTSARMGVSTDAFFTRLRREQLEIDYFCDRQFTALPGGNVLYDQTGQIIGSIGISGLAADDDHAITEYIVNLVKEEKID